MSIDDVSVNSRVSKKYVEAIENADRNELPQEVYLLGFLTLVIKALKLEDTDILDRYKEQATDYTLQEILESNQEAITGLASPPDSSSPRKKKKAKGKYFKIYQLYVLALIIIISFCVILVNKYKSNKTVNKVISPIKKVKVIDPKIEEHQELIKEKAAEEEKKKEKISKEKEKEKFKDRYKKRHSPKKEKNEQASLEEQQKEFKKASEDVKKQIKNIQENIEQKQSSEEKTVAQEPKQTDSDFDKFTSVKGYKTLKLKAVDTAWFQIIGVDQDKILFEGDVFPNYGPKEFNFKDRIGFVVATGNAGGILYNIGSGAKKLGEKGQIIKWYYPKEARAIYKSKHPASNKKASL